jgi:hypothetical protein
MISVKNDFGEKERFAHIDNTKPNSSFADLNKVGKELRDNRLIGIM